MHLISAIAALAIVVPLGGARVEADELPRRAPLGVAIDASATVQQVVPGLSGEALGIEAGDRVVGINGAPVGEARDLIRAASGLRESDPIEVALIRDGETLHLSGRSIGAPLETYAGARTIYGSVAFGEGRLRDILVLPERYGPSSPVVLFIPGHNCLSIDRGAAPDHPYSQLIRGLVERGVAVYRIEKPGLGDSLDTPACDAIDFHTELSAYQAGYERLTGELGVPPSRVVLFGHSMGVLQAPLLAARNRVAGVAVYGGGVRNWFDYIIAITSHQPILMNGADPAETIRAAEAARPIIARYYLEREAPADILASDPAAAPYLALLGWEGGDQVMGHHYTYWQDLAHLDLAAAWRDAGVPVLSLYGEADLVALNDEDHRLIAAIVNHYRPGQGRYLGLPDLDHLMTRPAAQGGREFAQDLPGRLADWIAETLAAPSADGSHRPVSGAQQDNEGSIS